MGNAQAGRSKPATDSQPIRAALERHEHRLVSYAMRLLGDLELARDAVQDTFVKLCDHAPELSSATPERLAGWLYTTCRNRALEMRRRAKRMASIEARAETPEAPPDPAGNAAHNDTARLLQQRLGRLPALQQEALQLKFQHDLSYREIARVMDKSVSHVGVLIHKGIQALRACMPREELGGTRS